MIGHLKDRRGSVFSTYIFTLPLHLKLPVKTFFSSKCAKSPVARIPEARDDVSVVVQLRVDHGGVHMEPCARARTHTCAVHPLSLSVNLARSRAGVGKLSLIHI